MPYVVRVWELGKGPRCDRLEDSIIGDGREDGTYIIGVRQGREGICSNGHCEGDNALFVRSRKMSRWRESLWL